MTGEVVDEVELRMGGCVGQREGNGEDDEEKAGGLHYIGRFCMLPSDEDNKFLAVCRFDINCDAGRW